MVILGKLNSERYQIACEADRVVVEQGPLVSAVGRVVARRRRVEGRSRSRPRRRVQPHETEDRAELAAHYLKILKDHATHAAHGARGHEGRRRRGAAQAGAARRALAAPRRRSRSTRATRSSGCSATSCTGARPPSCARPPTRSPRPRSSSTSRPRSGPRHVTDAAAWAPYVRKLARRAPRRSRRCPAVGRSRRCRPRAPARAARRRAARRARRPEAAAPPARARPAARCRRPRPAASCSDLGDSAAGPMDTPSGGCDCRACTSSGWCRVCGCSLAATTARRRNGGGCHRCAAGLQRSVQRARCSFERGRRDAGGSSRPHADGDGGRAR